MEWNKIVTGKNRFVWLVMLLGMCAVFAVTVFDMHQPHNNLSDGEISYYRMAMGYYSDVIQPYKYRIGVPIIVSHLPFGFATSFYLIALVSSAVTIYAIFAIWQELAPRQPLLLFAVLFVWLTSFSHWHMVYHYYYVDHAGIAFYAIGCLAVLKKDVRSLIAIIVSGSLFKETSSFLACFYASYVVFSTPHPLKNFKHYFKQIALVFAVAVVTPFTLHAAVEYFTSQSFEKAASVTTSSVWDMIQYTLFRRRAAGSYAIIKALHGLDFFTPVALFFMVARFKRSLPYCGIFLPFMFSTLFVVASDRTLRFLWFYLIFMLLAEFQACKKSFIITVCIATFIARLHAFNFSFFHYFNWFSMGAMAVIAIFFLFVGNFQQQRYKAHLS